MVDESLTVTIYDKGMLRGLTRMRAMAADTRPLMNAIGVGLVEVVHRRFETATDPQGVKWKRLNPEYSKYKTGPGILRQAGMSGGLQGSITFSATDRSVTIGTNKIYGAVHQFGATIVPKRAKFLVFRMGGRGPLEFRLSVSIPARPYLGFGRADEVMVRRVIHDVAAATLRG